MDKTDKTVKPLNRWILGTFTILAGLFFISIIIQVMLAGFALFVDYGDWNYHRSFIHLFEFVPLVMFILTFIGRLPKGLRWQSAGLYIMILLQYVTANLSSSIPYVAVLHPVIAMILFWRSLVTLQQSIKLIKTH